MIIACDIDGVLRDLHSSMYRELNQLSSPYKTDPIDRWKWEMWENIYKKSDSAHITKREFHQILEKKYIQKIYNDDFDYGIYDNIEWIEKRIKKGDKVIFLTNQPTFEQKRYTLDFIDTYFSHLEYDIAFTSQKELVYCDMYIDDSPVYLDRICEEGNYRFLICVNKPWNKKWRSEIQKNKKIISGIYMVNNLNELDKTHLG